MKKVLEESLNSEKSKALTNMSICKQISDLYSSDYEPGNKLNVFFLLFSLISYLKRYLYLFYLYFIY